jgi:hypothetical protein
LVDSFEPTLTEQEVNNLRVFWAKIWSAGGVEERERAAWRDLAASHGVGRAGWIIGQYVPLNPGDKPLRDTGSDILLIVPADPPLAAEAVAFWTDVWRAGGDAAAISALRPMLVNALGEAQATAIVRAPPVNLGDLPAAGSTRQNATVKVAPLQLTPLDQMPARRSSWSSAPRVELLPEKLLLIGHRNGTIDLERASLTIQTPLAAGPDPNAPPDEQLQPDGDSIKIPEELRWMFDFETALEMGMAFRVDLTPDQAARGFDRLIVLGVRVSDDAATGRQSLERLIEHHLLSRTGLSIVPQGTPTNNTEKGAAGSRFGDDPEAGFTAFYQQRPLYTVENNPMARRDGQWLAENTRPRPQPSAAHSERRRR